MTICIQLSTPRRIGQIPIGLITTSKYAPSRIKRIRFVVIYVALYGPRLIYVVKIIF